MNNLQRKQLDILKEFIRVCDKYNLRYFLVGGTCLGAARHKGFIPWDDDIDVAMPRSDYDKYIKLQKEYNNTPYFIQTWRSDKHYMYNYAKLRDSSTTYIENYWWCHQINHGVWIDIYPLDGFDNKIKSREKYASRIKRIWFAVWLSYLGSMFRKFRLKTFFKDLGLNIVAILFYLLNPFHMRQRIIDRKVKKRNFDKCLIVGNYFGINAKKEAMPKELFDEYILLDFEDIKCKVPKDYDKYLTLLFGDWRKLPPKEKQIGHHFDKGLDVNIDYKTYIKEHNI